MTATLINLMPSNDKDCDLALPLNYQQLASRPSSCAHIRHQRHQLQREHLSRKRDVSVIRLGTQEMHDHLSRRATIVEIGEQMVLWPGVCFPSTMVIEELG